MTTFQMIAGIAGILLVLSNFIDFKAFFAKLSAPAVAPVAVPVATVTQVSAPIKNYELSEIQMHPFAERIAGLEAPKVYKVVQKWEGLREQCTEYKLVNSVKRLDEVFPTFLDLVKEEIGK